MCHKSSKDVINILKKMNKEKYMPQEHNGVRQVIVM